MMCASSALSYSNEEDVGAYRAREAMERRTHSGGLKKGSSHISHLVLALLLHSNVSQLFNGDFHLVKLGNDNMLNLPGSGGHLLLISITEIRIFQGINN